MKNKKKEDNTMMDMVKAMQYTKKFVTVVVLSTFMLSCFGTYINYKNGYSLDAIVLKWIDFAIWVGGIYLAKAFAETYAEERNNLQRDIIEMQCQTFSESYQSNIEKNDVPEYEEVEI